MSKEGLLKQLELKYETQYVLYSKLLLQTALEEQQTPVDTVQPQHPVQHEQA